MFLPPTYLYKLTIGLMEKLISTEEEADILTAKLKRVGNHIDVQAAFVKRDLEFISLLRDAPDYPNNLKERGFDVDSFRQESIRLEDKSVSSAENMELMFLELKQAEAKIKGNFRHAQFLLRQVNILRFIVIATFAIGLAMASYGFYRWFVIQAFLDKAVINEALKK